KSIPNIDFSEKEISVMIIFILGGIKTYRMERLFYKNTEDYFISDIEEFKKRVNKIELDQEVDLVVNGILKLLTGGN
ncbi:MAG: hypothetical protein ACRC4Y_02020, partial [Cetobacterium sp.]